MIKCNQLDNGDYQLTSTNNSKSVLMRCYPGTTENYWSMKYESNGRIKNFGHYHEALQHLTKRGW